MIQLMIEIVVVWLAAILMGMPLFASMGLAAFAFVVFGGLSRQVALAALELLSKRELVRPAFPFIAGQPRDHHRRDDRPARPRRGR